MHKFASPSPDSRELVAELEFVWDQVKSNVPSSSSSSPLQHMGMHSYLEESRDHVQRSMRGNEEEEEDGDESPPLRVKSPMSQSEEDAEDLEDEIDREEFVDAPDSQYNPYSEDAAVQTDQDLIRQQPKPIETPTPAPRMRSLLPPISMPTFASPAPAQHQQNESAADKKWRARMEQALQKMTAEVAALREQLEARRLFSHSPHYRLFRGLWRWVWAGVKHVAVDVLILGLVLLILRRKKDRRLEGAIRVLLGDAVVRVQRMGGGFRILGKEKKGPT
jgi:hypothetical protein